MILLLIWLYSGLAMATDLSVMTFNMWGRDNYDRFPTLAAYLNKNSKADLLALCEVNGKDGRFLADMLGYHYTGYDELGIASKFPIKRTWREKLKPIRKYQRFFLAADIEHPSLGIIRFVSIHLAHEDTESNRPQDQEYTKFRRGQIEHTLKILEEIESKYPADQLILAGDFNSLPFEIREYKTLFNRVDGYKLFDFNNYQAKTWRPIKSGKLKKPHQRLDYIYVLTKKNKIVSKPEIQLFENLLPATERVKRDKKTNFVHISDHLSILHQLKSD